MLYLLLLRHWIQEMQRQRLLLQESFSTYNLNRVIIGDFGGLKALLRIIEVGDDLTAMMYAVRAIFNLCMINKNRLTAIEGGAVNVILKKVSDGACAYE
ncbi:hypothetical protein GIB67_007521 [Kingdonia uniflora]|uniref:Uncharacterized protein n=1 Tax=Kingdonia uniflora TaxID=39325 RepID=A0A7J7LW33_9MAGN|nr:hypothetical protein GIB67_007521 [Kingdonia uniflora]